MLAPPDVAPRPSNPLESLNPHQQAAVRHGCDTTAPPPLLIIAGAGCGKTSTLAYRIAHLVHGGADPLRILLMTFSRRAAADLERRVGHVLQRYGAAGPSMHSPAALPWSGTFHSIGARLLREYAERIGLSPHFTIHDRGDSEELMGLARQGLSIDPQRRRFPASATCIAIYSRVVNGQADLTHVLQKVFPWCAVWEAELRALFDAYVAAKQAQQVLDYDDLLLYWSSMMQEPPFAHDIGSRFDHVLIDEYQDTNRLQASIVQALKPDGKGVTVVGDDAQSIYGFRAATVRNILDFPEQYDPPATVVTLDTNYRSTQPILDASNAAIALAPERFAKDLVASRGAGPRPKLVNVVDEAEQARAVAAQVLAYREEGIALRHQAVLFRTSHHSTQLELELGRRHIPFVKYGGLRFLDAAHVKDVLAILRWAENPRGRVAGFRAARLVCGVGPATASRLLDAMSAAADPLCAMESYPMPASSADEWSELVALYRCLKAGSAGWPAELERVVAWYAPQLARLHDDEPARAADLEQLRAIGAGYASREQFLTELALDPPAAVSDEAAGTMLNDDYLILSTIHSAKGQEWKAVQVLNCVDGCIPSDMSTSTSDEIEEERRLLYVAMTRARDHLVLLVPQRFYVHGQNAVGDRHVYASRSRFLPEIVCDRFEISTVAVPAPTGLGAKPGGPVIDLAAKMRAAWSAPSSGARRPS